MGHTVKVTAGTGKICQCLCIKSSNKGNIVQLQRGITMKSLGSYMVNKSSGHGNRIPREALGLYLCRYQGPVLPSGLIVSLWHKDRLWGRFVSIAPKGGTSSLPRENISLSVWGMKFTEVGKSNSRPVSRKQYFGEICLFSNSWLPTA